MNNFKNLWYNKPMKHTKLTFVVILQFVNQTLEDLKKFNLTLVADQSDINLGYFTVTGTQFDISEFRHFLSGQKNI